MKAERATKTQLLRSLFPTLTDSLVLSFVFFALSDIHQVMREPTVSNLVHVLTSIQLKANSPFDYPGYLFMVMVAINIAYALAPGSRNNRLPFPDSPIQLPFEPGAVSPRAALHDCLRTAGKLRKAASLYGIVGQLSLSSIEAEVDGALSTSDKEELIDAVGHVFPGGRGQVRLDRSVLTSLLLSLCSAIGVPIGGVYHPLQRKVSINPGMSPLAQAYVTIHECLHSYGLGEVEAEAGTILFCCKVREFKGLNIGLLGLYLAYRCAAAYLYTERPSERRILDSLEISYGFRAISSLLFRSRKEKLERKIYIFLKELRPDMQAVIQPDCRRP